MLRIRFGYLAIGILVLLLHWRLNPDDPVTPFSQVMSTARHTEESPCVRRRSRYLASSSLASEFDDFPRSFPSASQRQYALRAAGVAFDRQRRGLSYPNQHPRSTVGPVGTQSVRYVGPNAQPLISKDITRRQVKSWDEIEYGSSRSTTAGRSRQENSQSISNEAGGMNDLQYSSYFYDSRPSTSRPRKSKSLFGASNRRTITNLPLKQRLSKLNTSNGRQYLFRNSEPSTTSIRVTPSSSSIPFTTPLTRQASSDIDNHLSIMSYSGENYLPGNGSEMDRAWSRTDFDDSRPQSKMRRRQSSPNFHTSQRSDALVDEGKVKKTGLKARFKAIFGRTSTTNEVPIQQVNSQITHYNPEWLPPAPPDSQILNRHVQRVASCEQLPSVRTYHDQQQHQTIRVASRPKHNLDISDPYRQTSGESKDTWERGTTVTETTSSRDKASKRLTVLYENQESNPSSSAGQVGRIKKLESFEQPIPLTGHYDSQAHVAELARAIRERSESATDTSETQSTGYPTIIRNGRVGELEDYYRPGFSFTNDSIPPIYGRRASSNETSASAWSQKSTIRKVRSSSNAASQFHGNSNHFQSNTPRHDSSKSTSRNISPATESVYSRDEDGVLLSNDSPSLRQQHPHQVLQSSRSSLEQRASDGRPSPTAYNLVPKTVGSKRDIVDYYTGPTPPSGIRSERSSADLNLSYPRSGYEQDIRYFHGQQNERLQHVPDTQSVRQFTYDWNQHSAKKEPSLKELQKELLLEDHVQRQQLARTSPLWNSTEEDDMLINNDGPYPRINTRKSGSAGVVPTPNSPNHRTSPNTISADQILSARELNYPPSRESTIDLDKTPRPRQTESSKPKAENRSLKQRLKSQSGAFSGLSSRFQAFTGALQDPFTPANEQNVWQQQASIQSQLHPNCPPSLRRLRLARLASDGSASARSAR